jgi:hypothetical protein
MALSQKIIDDIGPYLNYIWLNYHRQIHLCEHLEDQGKGEEMMDDGYQASESKRYYIGFRAELEELMASLAIPLTATAPAPAVVIDPTPTVLGTP